MKRMVPKVLALLLLCCMLLSMAACGNNGSTANVEKEVENLLLSQNVADSKTEENKTPEVQNVVNKNVDDAEPASGGGSVEDLAESDYVEATAPQADVDPDDSDVLPEVNAPEAIPEVTPEGEFNEEIVLVKVDESFDSSALGELKCVSYEPLYQGSKWYSVKLAEEEDTEEAVSYLTNLNTFEAVDYDYVMAMSADIDSLNVTDNPSYSQQQNLPTHNVPNGWGQAVNNGKNPGGSSDVIVAVIDTGVDYNHLDLRNNIWINTAEIPDNNKDDDGNGYVDDVYGWDCIGNDKDPMDDNGHGTHVAGIIASENNTIGGVGVAYNSKIMVIKAGNSSGYFNNSDIAEAVQYAYMNGASVINMSFGGSNISMAVEDALESAYNSCILVAAAGNDSLCNNIDCKECDYKGVSYPAALPYVIGVMSVNHNGKSVSSFSNYDHYPYDSIEYEVYAVGEAVNSTWPNNKFASLNGTSMAAPTVSGIAALLRSYYTDRQVYSTKFIQSQIVNTGTQFPVNTVLGATDSAHSVVDAHKAMTELPKPEVNLYDYHISDSTDISSKNNDNGVIDAGETIHLYVDLHNRGGVATDVNVSVDTLKNGEFTDPYFTIVNDEIALSDIGTYSVRESGDKYFEIIVSNDCPNDYLVDFNIRYTYKNGLDEKDKAVYEDDGRQKAQFNVSSGYCLPSVISEDTVFTNDRLYIIGENVLIPTGVTVTFEEGCRIQYYDDRVYYDSPVIKNYGTLIMQGTEDNMILINPSERYPNFDCIITNYSIAKLDYVEAMNLFVENSNIKSCTVSNSHLRHSDTRTYYFNDADTEGSGSLNTLWKPNVSYFNNYVELFSYAIDLYAETMHNNYFVVASSNTCTVNATDFENNIVQSLVKGNVKVSDRMCMFDGNVSNNMFICSDNENPASMLGFNFKNKSLVKDNYFSIGYTEYADQIISGYYNSSGEITVELSGDCKDTSALYPHITDVEIFNAEGDEITTVGTEEIKVRVTFSRPMDTTANTGVYFGTIEPYADYRIEGGYVSDTIWEGTYTLKSYIENGIQKLIVKNAYAADDSTKEVIGEYQLYEFNIDTSAAMAMNLFAVAKNSGIELNWVQDDYDTLMGYNIYRSTSKDGKYVKINTTVISPSENTFVDDNAEPGVTYWYTFTVVLSDFSESAPAGKVSCTAVDTINPTIYHTPVNQGYKDNNLVISCTASDNMKVVSVTLNYRTAGTSEWKSILMSKVNDKYSATVFGSELSLEGLEYYIVASDGVNTVSKGTAYMPYTVVIKESSAISRIGDVDGNGTVTTKDALMLMQCLNDELLLTDDEFRRADLNGDEVLSSAEALRILQYINGKVNTLEM